MVSKLLCFALVITRRKRPVPPSGIGIRARCAPQSTAVIRISSDPCPMSLSCPMSGCRISSVVRTLHSLLLHDIWELYCNPFSVIPCITHFILRLPPCAEASRLCKVLAPHSQVADVPMISGRCPHDRAIGNVGFAGGIVFLVGSDAAYANKW